MAEEQISFGSKTEFDLNVLHQPVAKRVESMLDKVEKWNVTTEKGTEKISVTLSETPHSDMEDWNAQYVFEKDSDGKLFLTQVNVRFNPTSNLEIRFPQYSAHGENDAEALEFDKKVAIEDHKLPEKIAEVVGDTVSYKQRLIPEPQKN